MSKEMSPGNNIPILVEVPSINSAKPHDTQIKKMIFVMNALEKGWCVKKRAQEYIFTKKHENRREVFLENYLETFVQSNFDPSILSKMDE